MLGHMRLLRVKLLISLAARVRHVAAYLPVNFLARIVKIVSLGFQGDRMAYSIIKYVVVFRYTQWAAQVGVTLLAKTCVNLSGAGDPHSVTAFAKIMR